MTATTGKKGDEMTDPAILFVKPKALNAADKRALKSAGVIVIEIDDPGSVKFVKAHAELSGSDLLVAAAKAISETPKGDWASNVRQNFADAVSKAIISNLGNN